MLNQILYIAQNSTSVSLPFIEAGVKAGFPSPAGDFGEKNLDLNELFIKHPSATFYIRVSGNSMIRAGIHDGDIMIVDRALEPQNHDIVIASIDGEFTVKRYLRNGAELYLMPENPAFSKIKIEQHADFQIWGVVTWVIHKTK